MNNLKCDDPILKVYEPEKCECEKKSIEKKRRKPKMNKARVEKLKNENIWYAFFGKDYIKYLQANKK